MRARTLTLLAGLTLSAHAHASPPGVTSSTLLKPGDPIPGLPGFSFAGADGSTAINNAGTVITSGILTGPGSSGSNNHILLAGQPGSLSLIAREADPVNTLPGYLHLAGSANLSAFPWVAIADDDTVACTAATRQVGQTANLNAHMAGPISDVRPVLYQNGPAPGFGADTLIRIEQSPTLATGGRLYIQGRPFPTNVNVVWTGDSTSQTACLQTGLQAPGLPIPTTISSFDDGSLRFNDAGRVTLKITLPLGNGVTQSNRVVLYEGPHDQLGIIARTGDPVPGYPAATLTNIDADTIRTNDAGAVVWGGFVTGGGTDELLITRGSGSDALLVKDGDPIPNHPGLTLEQVSRGSVEMNALGRIAFTAVIAGAPADSDTGVFIADPLGFSLAVREGDPLPGGGTLADVRGVTFDFNARDQLVLYTAAVTGQTSRSVLLATTPSGQLVELARSATGFASDDGFFGTLSGTNPWSVPFQAGSAQSGQRSVFNDEGQLIASLFFSGSTGSGVFLFDIEDPCTPDVNGDGILDNGDIGAFVALFLAGDLAADFNADGILDNGDIGAFVAAFLAGC